MAGAGSTVVHCPTTALKVSYGVTQIGKIPEMVTAGVNVSLGTDGNNASNYSDLMRATYLVAGLFKDARMDPQMFPAEKAYGDGHPGRGPHHADGGSDRLVGAGQAGRRGAARPRPPRVAAIAECDEPASCGRPTDGASTPCSWTAKGWWRLAG